MEGSWVGIARLRSPYDVELAALAWVLARVCVPLHRKGNNLFRAYPASGQHMPPPEITYCFITRSAFFTVKFSGSPVAFSLTLTNTSDASLTLSEHLILPLVFKE